MNFLETNLRDAFKYINRRQYTNILNGKGSDTAKWKLWIWLVEERKINPIEMPLNKYYES